MNIDSRVKLGIKIVLLVILLHSLISIFNLNEYISLLLKYKNHLPDG